MLSASLNKTFPSFLHPDPKSNFDPKPNLEHIPNPDPKPNLDLKPNPDPDPKVQERSGADGYFYHSVSESAVFSNFSLS